MNSKITFWFYKNPAFKMLICLASFVIILSYFTLSANFILTYTFFNLIMIFIFIKIKKTSVAYLLTIINIAVFMSYNIDRLSFNPPKKVIPDQKAIFSGNITKILKKTDKNLIFIANGSLKTKSLPKINNTNIMISLFKSEKEMGEITPGNIIFTNLTVSLPNKQLMPDEFNDALFLKSINVQWKGYSSSNNFAVLERKKNIFYFRDVVYEKIKNIIYENYSENNAPIALAVITGDKSDISADMKQDYSYSGTAHLLAVSGLHTGLIAFIIFFLLQPLKVKWLKFIIFTIMLTGFVILSGLQPSAVRAASMILIYYFLKLAERPIQPVNIISIVVILNIVIYPASIYSVGFQMSIFAVYGIAFLYPIFYNKLKNVSNNNSFLYNYFISSASLTLSATAITAPIVAYYFDVFSLISVLSNLFVIPIFISALVLLIVGLLFSTISGFVASYYFIVSDKIFKINNLIIQKFSSIEILVFTDENVLFLSIITTLIMILLFTARNYKHLIFRIALCFIAILIINPDNNSKSNNGIYPRKQLVAVIEEKKDSVLIMLIDRKPSQYPVLDYGVVNYINSQNKKIYLGYNGNAGNKIYDYFADKKAIHSFEITLKQLDILKNKLNLNEHLTQIIDIK